MAGIFDTGIFDTGIFDSQFDYGVSANAGAFLVQGQDAGKTVGYRVQAAAGGVALTGSVAALACTRIFQAGAGAWSINGAGAGTYYNRRAAAAPGVFGLTGQDATLTKAAGIVFDVAAGGVALTGSVAAFIHGLVLGADRLDLGLGAGEAQFYRHWQLTGEPGVINEEGSDALFRTGVFVPVPDRTLLVKFDSRTFVVNADQRSMRESSDDRDFPLPRENRAFRVSENWGL